MKVIKRNGRVEDFNSKRICDAIKSAMRETDLGVNSQLALDISNEIAYGIEISGVTLPIESIQDMVEDSLARCGRADVTRKYIQYRLERKRERESGVEKFGLLSKEFLSKYKHTTSPMTKLGELVYYRTYSRYLPERRRREYWWETVLRAVEYNCSLIPTSVKEAEQLYDNIFNLRTFLSGRSFWVGGTEVANKYPMSNFNCSFSIIDEFESLRDIFYLLMLGSGAGIRVLKSDVARLPKIRTDVDVTHLGCIPIPKQDRNDNTSLVFKKNSVEIIIGDSKDGWIQALDYYFKILTGNDFKSVNEIRFNYNHVRPKGESLKTFGGTASGHEALRTIFVKITNVIHKYQDFSLVNLKPIDLLDICNIIGEGVVVGGVRRTSEIVLIDSDDQDCINAKSDLYRNVGGVWKIDESITHRQMSNNTIYHKTKPSREAWHWQIEKMRFSGEPAFINEESASKRRTNFNGTNPCGEILLDNKGLCNLTTTNVMAFVSNNSLDVKNLFEVQRLSARASYRMTNVELELPKWNSVQKRDRLTGVSLTGWQDMVNATNMSLDEQADLLKRLRDIAKNATKELSAHFGYNDSLLVTTIKPEGTISQLPTVSSGLHFSHSPYYIRRVRINSHDPIVNVLEEMGYELKPEVGQKWETCTTKVVEFPVKAPNGKTKNDVSAIEQLEIYKMFMENYVDHNASITVHVREHEWSEVEQWVWDNWDEVVAISFLSLDDSFYELLPYESITEEQYKEMLSKVDGKYLTPDKIAKYESKYLEFELDESCDAGVCPIR
jgi:adenosylcobalamin-dependent ribonucleoside-triphosphate reductase